MGSYDMFGKLGIQLKIRDDFESYKVGNNVPYDDGVYIGFEGIVVVVDGKFVFEDKHLVSKWGDLIEPASIITDLNPIKAIVDQISLQKGR